MTNKQELQGVHENMSNISKRMDKQFGKIESRVIEINNTIQIKDKDQPAKTSYRDVLTGEKPKATKLTIHLEKMTATNDQR